MRNNDQITSAQIKKKLAKHSSSTVQRSRKQQGWTLQRTRYCQLIPDANKIMRLEYTQRVLESGNTFQMIFIDECSISLAHYQCTCYQKFDEPTKQKPKLVWAGISRHGATEICIFDGIMDTDQHARETACLIHQRKTS